MTPPAPRRAGLLIPLFSMPSSASWGIGEIPDISRMSPWFDAARLRALQLLPINEVPPGETSPYSAMSAMAIDPQYIAVERVEDFDAIGGINGLETPLRMQLDAIRASTTIDYGGVRSLKHTVLRQTFAHFRETEWVSGTRRSAALRAYIRDQDWWLDDYALFRALHRRFDEQPWTTWPEPLRSRDSGALDEARGELADEILYRQYLQWIADDQWADTRRHSPGLSLMGDLQFMVSGDSADVWARQEIFRLDASAGVPPDAFSETGQDWGLPVYRWDVLAARGFDWLRDRARRNTALFDGYRIDHLVGFYRTYFRPHDGGEAQFTPADEAEQARLGERVLEVFRSTGAYVTAEDLGVVPDFVRASLARLGIPGYKVLRWERHWDRPGQPFKDMTEYPAVAVVTSGTHDTEPLTLWWEGAPPDERAAVLGIPTVRAALTDVDWTEASARAALTRPLREALLATLYSSPSELLILPVQDVFGWSDRINQPATIAPTNWTWRLPWPVDRWTGESDALAVATQLAEWATRYGR